VLAVVASTDLARGLAHDPATRPDGFVIEGEIAGGHNAPPRGPHREDDYGQPIYDERDEVDLPAILALGLPVWLAGGYGTPEGLRSALVEGQRVPATLVFQRAGRVRIEFRVQAAGPAMAPMDMGSMHGMSH
jgi:NAD(P)H-dependent flavin oxidoreductase YrpB (nitropropane dioxygenase family)